MVSLFDTSLSTVAAAAASSAETDLLARFGVPSVPPLVEPPHSAVNVVASTTSDTIASTRFDTRMMAIDYVCPESLLYGGEEPLCFVRTVGEERVQCR
jgi:hypothetical protein